MSQNNPFDSAGKLLVRLQPHAMLAWISKRRPSSFRFHRWLDTHFPGEPKQPDRESDLVAEISMLEIVDRYWAWNNEIQCDHDSEMPTRMEEYRVKIKRFLRPDSNRGERYRIASFLVNLRGRSLPPDPDIDEEAGALFEFTYRIVNLCDLKAETILQEIADGQTPFAVLSWIPLMQGGDKTDIIQKWIEIATNIPNPVLRSDIGGLVKVFAECADNLTVWFNALKGWNEMTSKVIEGWKQSGRDEARIATRLETQQNFVIRLASSRFGSSTIHASQIQAIEDSELLDRMFDAVLSLNSWDELLAVK